MLDIQARLRDLRITAESDEDHQHSKFSGPIYTADLETDPFEAGMMIDPFAAGFYDGQNSSIFWGKDCIEKFFAFLETVESGVIYLHNFGGFDFFWMLPHFEGESLIRNGRIVATYCKAKDGKFHQLRDSYAILPMALRSYRVKGVSHKLEIDISKMKKEKREKFRLEITKYLKMDCVSLHELVTRFWNTFGDKMTVGSTAMGELLKVHDFIRIKTKEEDEIIRKQFYYGGRVQVFQGGVTKMPFKVYDVNSMYPFVMKNFNHPIGSLTSITEKLTKDTAFVNVEGWNDNAFPVRMHDGGLSFIQKYGIFKVTIHEYNAAKELGLFKTKRIIAAYNFNLQRPFGSFVDKFYNLRKKAKKDGDEILGIFYKFILNSAYGKFAQDPEQYMDYRIEPISVSLKTKESDDCPLCYDDICKIHWRVDYVVPECKVTVWKKSSPRPVYYNVATGCSITGAARSILMRAIANSKMPLYCDTDSLICKSLNNVTLSDNILGAWKLEAKGDTATIAGRKLYALWAKGECVKAANKGVRIEPKDIRFLAENPDHRITYKKDSPSFRVDGSYRFLERKVRSTY